MEYKLVIAEMKSNFTDDEIKCLVYIIEAFLDYQCTRYSEVIITKNEEE